MNTSHLKRQVLAALKVPFYNITSSEEERYTWFRIAKNGTRTLLEILEKNTNPDVNGAAVPYLKFRHRDHFRFCFIRNPWDRVVSCYSDKVVQKKLFPECWDKDFSFFVDYISRQNLTTCDRHIRLQTALFPINDVSFVGKFETFKKDAEFVLQKLNINSELVHNNHSGHLHYSEYYDVASVRTIERLYKKDIQFGDYSFLTK